MLASLANREPVCLVDACKGRVYVLKLVFFVSRSLYGQSLSGPLPDAWSALSQVSYAHFICTQYAVSSTLWLGIADTAVKQQVVELLHTLQEHS